MGRYEIKLIINEKKVAESSEQVKGVIRSMIKSGILEIVFDKKEKKDVVNT